MLVLTRKEGESVVINTSDGPVTVLLREFAGNRRAKLLIDAPKNCRIFRGELLDRDEREAAGWTTCCQSCSGSSPACPWC